MNEIAEKLLAQLPVSPSDLSERGQKRLHAAVPVPDDFEILWAAVSFKAGDPSGLVIADRGIVIKTPKEAKEQVYRIMPWSYFDPDEVPDSCRQHSAARRFLADYKKELAYLEKVSSHATLTGGPVRCKFHLTATSSVAACFRRDEETGRMRYRYFDAAAGRPIPVEVASDQYGKALQAMKDRVAEGQVPDVTDPEDAGSLVRKAPLTYRQLVHLAEAGAEMLSYDAATGIVTCRNEAGTASLPGIKDMPAAADICRMAEAKTAQALYTRKMLSPGASFSGNLAGSLKFGAAVGTIGEFAGNRIGRRVGSVVGYVGGLAGGTLAGAAARSLSGLILEDEASVNARLINAVIAGMTVDYLLSEAQLDALIDLLNADCRTLVRLQRKLAGAGRSCEAIEKQLKGYFEKVR